ncbi:inositol monophosphatase family protein [Sagittula salina]|uniref:3'(2'),5'-bisphosphate nucleotidase CysQ n=1 Tax=Sagittula salina TaxID=2820268 RepID=A0A940MHG4_9RHOB|nr:3'(2'),5'-bisphosphate nucleotidase CysQ [Sagittula salina]MBP0481586.1 3'(2'),5'-bisphosphate nucleotidase CysQ [Sagittula salina]
MPETDLALLTRAAHEAGTVARGFLGQALDIRYKDGDAGPVTKADLAVNARLEEILRDARPGYGWLSEESTDDTARMAAETAFIVDPIDGTRSYIEGANTWAHALAVAQAGTVTAAVVFLPMLDRMYTAALGHGARLNGLPITVTRRALPERAEVLATRSSLEPHHWPGGVPRVSRHHRPSLAYRQALVAEGRFDAMFTFRPTWEWDIAAGSLILSEAGARVSDRRGGRLQFNAPHPQADGMVAANPALHDAFLQRLLPGDTPTGSGAESSRASRES